MAKKVSERREWKFTKGRRESLAKARKEHVNLVRLGEKARARGMK